MKELTQEQKLEIAGWLKAVLKVVRLHRYNSESGVDEPTDKFLIQWADAPGDRGEVTDREWERVMWLVEETFFKDARKFTEYSQELMTVIVGGEFPNPAWLNSGLASSRMAIHATPLQRYLAAKQVKGRGGE